MKRIFLIAVLLQYCCIGMAQTKMAGIRVNDFETSEDRSGDFNQAGCLYYRQGVKEGGQVFVLTQDALIKINGKLRRLKNQPLKKDDYSLNAFRYQDQMYTVDIRTNSVKSKDGTNQKIGRLTVTNKSTKQKVTIKIEGICGS